MGHNLWVSDLAELFCVDTVLVVTNYSILNLIITFDHYYLQNETVREPHFFSQVTSDLLSQLFRFYTRSDTRPKIYYQLKFTRSSLKTGEFFGVRFLDKSGCECRIYTMDLP